MRQWLAFGTVLVLVLGFAACGSETVASTDTTVIPDTSDPGPGDPGQELAGDPGPTDEGVAPGDEGVSQDVCTPACGTKVCGGNGCGGSCGACDAAKVCCDKEAECAADYGKCIDPPKPPEGYAPAGYVSALQTPADPTTAQTVCVDFTADGKGDSSLVNLAGQLNGPLSDAVKGGDIGIIFEFGDAAAPVADFANAESFTLNGLLGEPITAGDLTQQYVTPDGFDPATGKPLISFANAKITAGALAAGPSKFTLTIPVEGIPLSLTLNGATLKGKIDADSSKDVGVSAKEGVLAGIITKDEVDTVIANLQATCDAAAADAKPSYCQYLTVAKSAEALLFTLHDNGDGTYVPKSKDAPGNAAAACFTYELSKVTKLEPKPETPAP